MNTKKDNVQTEKILKFVENNPKCEVATLIAKTGIAKSTAYGILKNLREAGKLNYVNKLYTLADQPATIKRNDKPKAVKVKTAPVKAEVPVVEEVKAEVPVVEEVKAVKVTTDATTDATTEETTEETTEGKNFGRDFTKLIFNGQEYRKGKYVHAGLAAYVEANPTVTFAQLEKLFPAHLVRTFGLFRKSEEARKINIAGKQRYHGRRDMILTLGCGTEVSVTNQISRDNFPGIVDAFKSAGIITEVEYAMLEA